MSLTVERAKEISKGHVTEESLVIHSLNVCYAMGAMAKHFGEDVEHWQAVGYLHDYDYQEFPEEHLQHTEKELLSQGVSEEDVRAILAHGFEIVNQVEPKTNMEKSLFTVDELTGIIQACARMRPNGILDLEVKSFMKKFKDKKFAAGCSRDVIRQGAENLGWELDALFEQTILAMRSLAGEMEI